MIGSVARNMMLRVRRYQTVRWTVFAVILWAGVSEAILNDVEEIDLILDEGKAPDGVSWSEWIQHKSEGLVWPGKGGDLRDVWIETGRIPAGLAWRPADEASIRASVYGVEPEFPFGAYVRYGCDGVHWSTWYAMESLEKPPSGAFRPYHCIIKIPFVAKKVRFAHRLNTRLSASLREEC